VYKNALKKIDVKKIDKKYLKTEDEYLKNVYQKSYKINEVIEVNASNSYFKSSINFTSPLGKKFNEILINDLMQMVIKKTHESMKLSINNKIDLIRKEIDQLRYEHQLQIDVERTIIEFENKILYETLFNNNQIKVEKLSGAYILAKSMGITEPLLSNLVNVNDYDANMVLRNTLESNFSHYFLGTEILDSEIKYLNNEYKNNVNSLNYELKAKLDTLYLKKDNAFIPEVILLENKVASINNSFSYLINSVNSNLDEVKVLEYNIYRIENSHNSQYYLFIIALSLFLSLFIGIISIFITNEFNKRKSSS